MSNTCRFEDVKQLLEAKKFLHDATCRAYNAKQRCKNKVVNGAVDHWFEKKASGVFDEAMYFCKEHVGKQMPDVALVLDKDIAATKLATAAKRELIVKQGRVEHFQYKIRGGNDVGLLAYKRHMVTGIFIVFPYELAWLRDNGGVKCQFYRNGQDLLMLNNLQQETAMDETDDFSEGRDGRVMNVASGFALMKVRNKKELLRKIDTLRGGPDKVAVYVRRPRAYQLQDLLDKLAPKVGKDVWLAPVTKHVLVKRGKSHAVSLDDLVPEAEAVYGMFVVTPYDTRPWIKYLRVLFAEKPIHNVHHASHEEGFVHIEEANYINVQESNLRVLVGRVKEEVDRQRASGTPIQSSEYMASAFKELEKNNVMPLFNVSSSAEARSQKVVGALILSDTVRQKLKEAASSGDKKMQLFSELLANIIRDNHQNTEKYIMFDEYKYVMPSFLEQDPQRATQPGAANVQPSHNASITKLARTTGTAGRQTGTQTKTVTIHHMDDGDDGRPTAKRTVLKSDQLGVRSNGATTTGSSDPKKPKKGDDKATHGRFSYTKLLTDIRNPGGVADVSNNLLWTDAIDTDDVIAKTNDKDHEYYGYKPPSREDWSWTMGERQQIYPQELATGSYNNLRTIYARCMLALFGAFDYKTVYRKVVNDHSITWILESEGTRKLVSWVLYPWTEEERTMSRREKEVLLAAHNTKIADLCKLPNNLCEAGYAYGIEDEGILTITIERQDVAQPDAIVSVGAKFLKKSSKSKLFLRKLVWDSIAKTIKKALADTNTIPTRISELGIKTIQDDESGALILEFQSNIDGSFLSVRDDVPKLSAAAAEAYEGDEGSTCPWQKLSLSPLVVSNDIRNVLKNLSGDNSGMATRNVTFNSEAKSVKEHLRDLSRGEREANITKKLHEFMNVVYKHEDLDTPIRPLVDIVKEHKRDKLGKENPIVTVHERATLHGISYSIYNLIKKKMDQQQQQQSPMMQQQQSQGAMQTSYDDDDGHVRGERNVRTYDPNTGQMINMRVRYDIFDRYDDEDRGVW